jgi:Rhs element Vgr protein
MAKSPLLNTDGVCEFHVFCNGKELPTGYSLVSADISFHLNSIPKASIVIRDGDMPTASFPISDQELFVPGAEIKITAGFDLKQKELFKGIIIKHGVSIDKSGRSRLNLECKDKSVAMTCARKNAHFVDKSDKEIITKLIKEYGLKSEVNINGPKHKELTQYYCSDWDFMMLRAEANSCFVSVYDGKIRIEEIRPLDSAKVCLTWGKDIISFKADMDAETQVSSVQARAWDWSKLDMVSTDAPQKTFIKQGDIDGKKMADVLKVKDTLLQSGASLSADELKIWAKAEQSKRELSKIKGSATCIGTDEFELGSVVELNGVGKRFCGNALISGIQHHLKKGSFKTEVSFGMDNEWFVEKYKTVSPLASGLNSGINGLLPGIVLKLDGDPEKQNRIQVKIPLMKNETEGIWARLSSPYASKEIGSFFVPEVGDEVILGFFNADPSSPVILGSLYSSGRTPPKQIESENNIKTLVTRSKITVEFDEEKKAFSLKTPDERSIILSDKDKLISISDKKGNKIEFTDNGIEITSPKDISISSKAGIKIDAVKDIAAASKSGNINAEGVNVELKAKASLTAKGTASAEFSASGTTTIKGAMVMIN